MNKKALIALVVVVIAALGGGLYYRNYSEKNETPPVLQASTGLYQGSTAAKTSGFLKADKSKTGTNFKQTKKDSHGNNISDKATLKFVVEAGGLSDVYAETDTNLDEITKNFKASAEGQEYMAGFYNVADGLWKTTKQTWYGFDGINVITDVAALAKTIVPAKNTFVFVSDKDAELYGYKDTSVEPTSSYDFCLYGKAGWNSGVVKKDELAKSISGCMDSVTSVWVKTANYPLDKKFTKIYTSGGSEDALKAYRMSKFYMVWVKFSEDPMVKDAMDTGRLTISNLQLIGDTNVDNTIDLDSTFNLAFAWDATYDGATISQFGYDITGESFPALSYTWTIKTDTAPATTLWELTKEYGTKTTEVVSSAANDQLCFLPLYDAKGTALATGKDWNCPYISLPGNIKLVADTKYTFEVTAFDGKDSVKTSIDFTTEKAKPQTSKLIPWGTMMWDGYGSVTWDDTLKQLSMAPKISTKKAETHSALVVSDTVYKQPFQLSYTMKTTKQLRENDAPNAWEVGWTVFGYKDDGKFKYMILKPNGLEIGESLLNDVQEFLYTSDTDKFPINTNYNVVMKVENDVITLSVNGKNYASYTMVGAGAKDHLTADGKIGFYTEDAAIQISNIKMEQL